jgi:TatD DNase family protein
MREEQLKSFNYIDVHCHAYEYLKDEIEKLENTLLVSVSEDLNSAIKNFEIKENYNILVFVGIHPWNVFRTKKEEIEKIKKLIENADGIGEIGLDKNAKNFKKQLEIFEFFVTLAKEHSLPINLHCYNSFEECCKFLEKYEIEKVNFHWFKDYEKVEILKERNWFASFNINIKFEKKHRMALEKIDKNLILTESDGPYKYRKILMHSSQIPEIVKEIEKIKGKVNIKRNFKKFFF